MGYNVMHGNGYKQRRCESYVMFRKVSTDTKIFCIMLRYSCAKRWYIVIVYNSEKHQLLVNFRKVSTNLELVCLYVSGFDIGWFVHITLISRFKLQILEDLFLCPLGEKTMWRSL